MLRINSITFTGKVTDIRGKKAFRAMLVKGLVSGKMLTEYPVFIKAEAFEKLKISIGDEVCILNAKFWQSEDKYRFQVERSEQIRVIRPDETCFSYSDFSGTVTALEEESNAFIVLIEQDDEDKHSVFPLVMSKKVYDSLIFTFGDEVLVSNAQAYKKNGIFRFRIAKKEQVKIVKRGNPDLGVIRAEDKFI